MTVESMQKYAEYFSRKFDKQDFDKALKIFQNLTAEENKKPKDPSDKVKVFPLFVHTFELYDKAFTFPRIRKYEDVEQNLDMLAHFEDNLNTNIDNSVHLANFLRVATTVHKNLMAKYGNDGFFNDPALVDPYAEAKDEGDWSKVAEKFVKAGLKAQ